MAENGVNMDISGFLRSSWQGILLSVVIAVPSWVLVKSIDGLEVVGAPIIAIVAGMVVSILWKRHDCIKKGTSFTSKYVLQFSVVLLGFGLNLSVIGRVGLDSLPIIVSTISTSLIVAYALYRIMRTPVKTTTLVGIGSSICGGSAIAAAAPVIKADNDEIAQSIAVIFFFNVVAAIIFPTLGQMLGMSDEGFALFAGTAINDTSSVTAAASTWDAIHGTGSAVLDQATIVKLTRTLFIIPIVLVLSYITLKKEPSSDGHGRNIRRAFPMFILYFILASVITTVCTSVLTGDALEAANGVFSSLKQVSAFLIVVAMAAIGLNTNLVELVRTGGKPLTIGFFCWVSIAAVSLLMQHFMGFW